MKDLISRQAAIDRIEEHIRVGDELYPLTETDRILNHAFEIAASCVYNLPSAERKKGKWVAYIGRDLGIEGQWMRDDGKTVFVQCDQCGELYVRNFMANWNYCPNCGAEMRGEEDDTE